MGPQYDWREVAYTINGYTLAGSRDACAARARAVSQTLEAGGGLAAISTTDLRLYLFFSARAAHHTGDYAPGSFGNAIVVELVRRNGEEWMDAELARLRSETRR